MISFIAVAVIDEQFLRWSSVTFGNRLCWRTATKAQVDFFKVCFDTRFLRILRKW